MNLMNDLFNDKPPIKKIVSKSIDQSPIPKNKSPDLFDDKPSKSIEDSSYFKSLLGKKLVKNEFKAEPVINPKDSIDVNQNFQSDTSKRRPGTGRRKPIFDIDDSDILKPNKKMEKPFPQTDEISSIQKESTAGSVWLQQSSSPKKAASEASPIKSNTTPNNDWMSNLIGSKNTSQSNPSIQSSETIEKLSANQTSIIKEDPQINAAGNAIEMNKLIGKLELEFQMKMVEYQKQQQINLLESFQKLQTEEGALLMHEDMKKIQVDLHKSTIMVESLKAEIDCIKSNHSDEIYLLQEAFRKKSEIENDIFQRNKEALNKENLLLKTSYENKIKLLEQEKNEQRKSFETLLETAKTEWIESLKATKEARTQMLESVEEDNTKTLRRICQMKDLEMKTAMNVNSHSQDAKIVLDQLETNVASISDITSIIAERRDEALELTKKSLEMRDQQLKNAEKQQSILREQAEQERNRLTILIARLEDSLAHKNSEIELENWKIAQAENKIRTEIKMFLENKKEFSETIDRERKSIEITKQKLLEDRQQILEAASMRGTYISDISKHNQFKYARFDHDTMTERMSSDKLTEKSNLDKDMMKIAAERKILNYEKEELKMEQCRLSDREARMEDVFASHSKFLQDINASMSELNLKEESLNEEITKLDSYRNEIINAAKKNFCPSCKESLSEGQARTQIEAGHLKETRIQHKKTHPSRIIEKLKAARQIEDGRRQEINKNTKLLKKIFNHKTDNS